MYKVHVRWLNDDLDAVNGIVELTETGLANLISVLDDLDIVWG